MPQLMPLNWFMSSFVVFFLMLMMVLIYFDVKVVNDIVMDNSEKMIFSWEW